MANFVTIEAEARARAGKGAARATRRAGRVPAVIYGAKQEPTLISLEPKAVLGQLKQGGWRSRLFELKVGTESTRALMRGGSARSAIGRSRLASRVCKAVRLRGRPAAHSASRRIRRSTSRPSLRSCRASSNATMPQRHQPPN